MKVYALDFSDPNTNPLARFSTFAHLLNVFIPLLIVGAALLLLVMLLYGAFTILTAAGNPENIKKAQKIFTFAILGLIVVILSFLFVKLISIIFNISAPIQGL